VVRSDARDQLDELAQGLSGIEYGKIVTVGYADRIGTQSYNLRLSQRRANSVKSYLVSKGIPAERISTEGRGELDPATAPDACVGLRRQKLIDCLQPDGAWRSRSQAHAEVNADAARTTESPRKQGFSSGITR
jgi:OOP family OmpA-OmpF porin